MGIECDLPRKTPPQGLAFIKSKVSLQVAKQEKQPIVLPNCDAHEPQKWQGQQDILEGMIVMLMS